MMAAKTLGYTSMLTKVVFLQKHVTITRQRIRTARPSISVELVYQVAAGLSQTTLAGEYLNMVKWLLSEDLIYLPQSLKVHKVYTVRSESKEAIIE